MYVTLVGIWICSNISAKDKEADDRLIFFTYLDCKTWRYTALSEALRTHSYIYDRDFMWKLFAINQFLQKNSIVDILLGSK